MSVAVDTMIAHGTTSGRALELLGSGVPQESVASALGVTPSYISQLLSDRDFAAEVTRRKYEALTKHTERDAKYDGLEDTLLARLKNSTSLLFKPLDIMRALKVVNEAKRRGTDSKESIIAQQNIVEITMPTQIVQQFTTNIVNQVVKAGDQDLTTIQSNELLKSIESPHPEAYLDAPPESEAPVEEPTPQPNILENNTLLDSL